MRGVDCNPVCYHQPLPDATIYQHLARLATRNNRAILDEHQSLKSWTQEQANKPQLLTDISKAIASVSHGFSASALRKLVQTGVFAKWRVCVVSAALF